MQPGHARAGPLPEVTSRILEGCSISERRLRRGADLCLQGEPCTEAVIIADGWMFLYHILPNGRRQILDFGLPGTLVCFQPDMRRPMAYSVQSLTDVLIWVVAIKDLLRLAERHADFGLHLVSWTADATHVAYNRLTSVGRRSAKERIAYLLLELFCRVRQTQSVIRGETVRLPLTQEHIADTLGLSLVHVNRTLHEMRALGLVDLRSKVLRILDPDALAELAGYDDGRGVSTLNPPSHQEI